MTDPSTESHDNESSRLWGALQESRDEVRKLEGDIRTIAVQVDTGFKTMAEQLEQLRETAKPPGVLAVIGIIVVTTGLLLTGLTLYVDNKVLIISERTDRIMEEDDDMNTDLDIMEGQIADLYKEQGIQEEKSRWLEMVYAGLRDRVLDHEDRMDDMAQSLGEAQATQDWVTSWLDDVDNKGSRRWIGDRADE